MNEIQGDSKAPVYSLLDFKAVPSKPAIFYLHALIKKTKIARTSSPIHGFICKPKHKN